MLFLEILILAEVSVINYHSWIFFHHFMGWQSISSASVYLLDPLIMSSSSFFFQPSASQKKQSGISDISIPKWTFSFSVLEALFSLHDLVTWLQFYCSHIVFWGLDLTGTGWFVLMATTVAVFLQEGLRFLHEVLWAALVWGPIDTSLSTFPGVHVRVF